MSVDDPAGSTDKAPAFVASALELLGDSDPLEVMSRLVHRLESDILDVPDEILRRPETPGRWSIAEVIQHLADSEIVFGYRFRAVLTSERPVLPGWDQVEWSNRFRYAEQSIEDSLAVLRSLRIVNVRLLRQIDPADLGRIGIHSTRGEETLGRMIELTAGHDLVHRRQIRRIRLRHGLDG